MSKYQGLGNHLKKEGKDTIEMNFKEIESILGFSLPKSATKFRPWWSNDITHTQAKSGWLLNGYRSENADIKKRTVVFRKLQAITRTYEKTSLSKKEFFSLFAQKNMSNHFGKDLAPRKENNWLKTFDLVSQDLSIVGASKLLTSNTKYIQSTNLSTITEQVWFLEKNQAETKFIVFGNNKVPQEWLNKYGRGLKSIDFYLLLDDGEPVLMKKENLEDV